MNIKITEPELVFIKYNELIKYVKSLNMVKYVSMQYYYDTLADHFGYKIDTIRKIIYSQLEKQGKRGGKRARSNSRINDREHTDIR